jgi:hypothetical protein
MARNLYRFYLYAVFLVMLILAAVGLGWLLQPLLALTALRGAYDQPPTNQALVQGVVFFVISWLIAGLLGGLHYVLIRRDMRDDPGAGNQGIRAFFLNITELVAAPIGIGLAAEGVISQLGQAYSGNLSYQAATALAFLALFAVLELERQRSPASSGAALFFQRLHVYGAQFILLNILVAAWSSAFTALVSVVAFSGQANVGTPCAGFVTCSNGPNLFSLVAAALWMVVFWLGYGWLASGDAPSLFRRIVLAISFAYGIILLIIGVYSALALLFRDLFGAAPSAAETLSGYNFSSSITLGLLVSGAYLIWLRMPSRQQQPQRAVVLLLCQAIIAALMAGTFFWGLGYALLNALESPASPVEWSAALALIVTGAAYVVLDVRLHSSKRANVPGAMDALRGFVFALLGAGILAVAIGGAVALYAWITALLGSPLTNWPHVLHIGLAACISGAVVVALYLWRASREQLISLRLPAQPPAIAAVTTPPGQPAAVPPGQEATLEGILDDLLAGKMSRDMAAARIRALRSGVSP